jgi:hypothetical protein
MMFELVKNSLRAVQERYMNSDKHAPPVRIIVADGAEDVTIKVPEIYFSLFCSDLCRFIRIRNFTIHKLSVSINLRLIYINLTLFDQTYRENRVTIET